MNLGDLHSDWSALFLRAFVASGVEHIVISPGSRSTPLALAAAKETGLVKHVLIDERAAAFFALGQARITKRPTLLLCTSGSAVAHYLPAIIEANLAHIPLIAITADRPWEAYDNASAQTIDQVKIFGDHARWYAELGLPDPAPEALRAVPRLAAQTVARAAHGPVHINARFRKPLEPAPRSPEPWRPELDRLFTQGAPRVFHARQTPSNEAIDALTERLQKSQRTLFVYGPALHEMAGEHALQLAAKLNIPVFAEASSGVRFRKHHGARIIGAFDSFLRSKETRQQCKPDLIVSFGMPPVSSSYNAWLTEDPNISLIVASSLGWNDPNNLAQTLIGGDPELLAKELLKQDISPNQREWVSLLSQHEARAQEITKKHLSRPALSEGSIAQILIENLPEESVVLLGNSNPIRDVDTYCAPREKTLTVLHQRGASGIDGLIATASGARSVTHSPVALFLGDISFLHDLGGVNAMRSVRGPLIVVVVQNNGGRIFAQLPLGKNSDLAETTERYFATPQDLSLEDFARGFGISYEKVETKDALKDALQNALHEKQKIIIEAVVPNTAATKQRSELWSEISATSSALCHAVEERHPEIDEHENQPLDTDLRRYDRPAQAPVLYFLHGFLGRPSMWSRVIEQLPVGMRHTSITLPGHGPAPWFPRESSFLGAVSEIAQSLPDGVHLVGYSLGARVSLALALLYPEKIARATLIGVDPGLSDAKARAERLRWDEEQAKQIETLGVAAFAEQWAKLPIFATQEKLSDRLRIHQQKERNEHTAAGAAWAMRTLGLGQMPSLRERLAQNKVPLHLITGALDQKFTAIAKEMSQFATHTIAPDVGHNVALEAPDIIIREVRLRFQ